MIVGIARNPPEVIFIATHSEDDIATAPLPRRFQFHRVVKERSATSVALYTHRSLLRDKQFINKAPPARRRLAIFGGPLSAGCRFDVGPMSISRRFCAQIRMTSTTLDACQRMPHFA